MVNRTVTFAAANALLAAELERLAAQLEAAAPGREVWRVAGDNGAYCIEFDRSDSLDPKRECEEWFDSHFAYCHNRGYTVQSARTYTQAESESLAVAAQLRQLANERQERRE